MWKNGKYSIPDKSNVGIVVVGNVLNFSIYKDILLAYSKNVPSSYTLTGDDYPRAGGYVSLKGFKFHKK